jgi:hypothetical protein
LGAFFCFAKKPGYPLQQKPCGFLLAAPIPCAGAKAAPAARLSPSQFWRSAPKLMKIFPAGGGFRGAPRKPKGRLKTTKNANFFEESAFFARLVQ